MNIFRLIICSIAVVFLATSLLPQNTQAYSKEEKMLTKELKAISKKTYRYFEDFTDQQTTGLTSDAVRFNDGEIEEAKHTSPTNVSMYMMSTISAEKSGLISRKEAVERLKTTLHTLQGLKKWNGLFYNWYYTDGSLKTDWGQFISQVDNGWLSAGLIVTGQAYKELYPITGKLVEEMDYSTLYDSAEGQFRGGYDVEKGQLTEHHYGLFYTEPRVASYLSIGKGDVPEEHWWRMYRTMPAEWDWQSQIPSGKTKTYDGTEVFEGHYTYKGIRFVPSWGGSMFEGLMPGLVLKEKELGKKALGLNNQRHVDLQIAYAKEKGYKAWGFSPAATPDGYSEFAATPLGTSGYKDGSTVTPHATFLALEYALKEARKNLKTLKQLGAYGKYGFYDSVNLASGEVTKASLALDQGMIMASIANYLYGGIIRDYFHSDPIGKRPEHLLKKETFSIQ